MLKSIPAASLITQRFPIAEAAAAYRLLDESPERAIGVVMTY
jgi:threonine dehydrogenase-like Zn-dependent dehydrogenase